MILPGSVIRLIMIPYSKPGFAHAVLMCECDLAKSEASCAMV